MVYGSDSITRGAGASLVSETSDEGKGRRGHLVLAMLGGNRSECVLANFLRAVSLQLVFYSRDRVDIILLKSLQKSRILGFPFF